MKIKLDMNDMFDIILQEITELDDLVLGELAADLIGQDWLLFDGDEFDEESRSIREDVASRVADKITDEFIDSEAINHEDPKTFAVNFINNRSIK